MPKTGILHSDWTNSIYGVISEIYLSDFCVNFLNGGTLAPPPPEWYTSAPGNGSLVPKPF